MLFREDVPVAIVEQPPAFPDAGYEGLIVEPDAWPPLLHPRMLMDLEGYSAWERHMVARCSDLSLSPESVLATLERDARVLRTYVPGRTGVADAVRSLPIGPVSAPIETTLAPSLALHAEVMAAVPEDLRPASDETDLADVYAHAVAPNWARWRAPLNRYLAAKAFASWTAYQGRGVLAIVRGLEAALALVRVEAARQCRDAGRPLEAMLLKEAIRGADFALNHLAIAEDLAAAWSRVEDAAPYGTSNTAITGP
jgi:hypothetical protein